MKQRTIRVWAAALCLVLLSLLALPHLAQEEINPGLRGEEEQVLLTRDDYDSMMRFSRMDEILSLAEEHYYGEVDRAEMLEYGKHNLFVPLDDSYTLYYTADDMESQNEKIEGEYAGIGLQLLGDMNEDTINITRVFRDSPADHAGMLRGDLIVAVNGEPYSAATMTDAVAVMRGEPGTEVTVTVERLNSETGLMDTIDFTLPRQIVQMDSAAYEMLDDEIGYVLLYDFMGNDVDDFFDALTLFVEKGAKGMIVDLRDNRGGLVNDAVAIADALMPEGLVVYTEDRYGKRQESRSDAQHLGWPIVVLVNEYSASASEILAGALQDADMATIVGVTTFGKGIVQQVLPLGANGEGMQYTISRYFTPAGRSIHGIGIEPDVVVEQPEDILAQGTDITHEEDVQLQKAIEVLRGMMAEAEGA